MNEPYSLLATRHFNKFQTPQCLWLLILVLSLVTNSCGRVNKSSHSIIDSANTPTPSSIIFQLTEVSYEQVEPFFDDEISQQILSGIDYFTQQGFVSIHTLSRYGPSQKEFTSGVYEILKLGQGLTGYLLLVDTLMFSHDFALVTTLDYQPVQVLFENTVQVFPLLHIEPGTRRAFEFSLPPLSEGLHVITLTYIIEPNHYFTFRIGKESDPLEHEALSHRDSPFGFGLLILVTPEPPDSVSDWPEQARSPAPETTTLIMEALLFKEKPRSGTPAVIFNEDTARPGETKTYYMRFIASEEGDGYIPAKVLVFWDEILTQTSDLSIPIQATWKEEYLPLTIKVPAQTNEGIHFLTVIAYPYPYLLRGWGDGSEWSTPVGPFSNLMARVPITVKTPK